MADESDRRPPVETIPSVQGAVSAVASANAPFIYFDTASTFGLKDGIANITLEVVRFTSSGDKVLHDRVAVAHLRIPPRALDSLRDAIRAIDLMAKPAPSGSAN